MKRLFQSILAVAAVSSLSAYALCWKSTVKACFQSIYLGPYTCTVEDSRCDTDVLGYVSNVGHWNTVRLVQNNETGHINSEDYMTVCTYTCTVINPDDCNGITAKSEDTGR